MTPQELAAEFPLTPDSLPQPGVPQGRLEKFSHVSRVFRGAERDGWIYVPAQYDPATPACVMVVQDGIEHLKHERRWHIPTVLDNLIHRGEMPVTIGIFLNPGSIPSPLPGGQARYNRSFEYDSLGDRYARFLIEEILPEVGSRYALSDDPNSRCIMGGSSGAFCAFNVAWERPDAFRRVISIVGSYTALRGGHLMPPLVRLTEPKPLRVFLQSGANDLRVFAGDWWTANLEMLSALEYAGYEVQHVWAEHAGHDEFHGSMVFPDAVRWVWQGYPGSISAGVNSRQPLAKFLVAGAGWKKVEADFGEITALGTDARGRVLLAEKGEAWLRRIEEDGSVKKIAQVNGEVTALACTSDGTTLLALPAQGELLAIDAADVKSVRLSGVKVRRFCIAKNGDLYFTVEGSPALHLVRSEEPPRALPISLQAPLAIGLTPDEGQLFVTDPASVLGCACTVQPDGTLSNESPYYRLATLPEATASGATNLAVSREGWNAVATPAGVQLLDRNGLLVGLMPLPGGKVPSAVAIAGEKGDQLFAASGAEIYRRLIRPKENLWC